jgi:hypothetical protein
MEKVTRKLQQTTKALKTFEEIIKKPYSKIIRDAAIRITL